MKKNIVYLATVILVTSCASVSTVKKAKSNLAQKEKNAKSQHQCKSLNESIGETTADSWFKEHSKEQEEYKNRRKIEQKYYYDIRPLKLPLAIRALKTEPILKLEERKAKYYNPHYKSEKDMQPYLIRGVFTNFTGGISLYENNNVLTVSSYSLGRRGSLLFTPFVVNLAKKPSKLILSVGGGL